MNRIVKIEVIFTIGLAIFFGIAGHIIDTAKPTDLSNYVPYSPIILAIIAIALSTGKFVLIRKRLGKMSERLMPVKSHRYKTKVIVSAFQATVSLETGVVSSYALVMFLIALAFGANTTQFHNAVHLEHLATLGLFPVLDVIQLIIPEIRRK